MQILYLSNVSKFLEDLDHDLHNKVIFTIEALSLCGHELSMPVSKPLRNGLFELRILGQKHIRIFYCFHKNQIYLLHAIVKKSQKIPEKDLDRAFKLLSLLRVDNR